MTRPPEDTRAPAGRPRPRLGWPERSPRPEDWDRPGGLRIGTTEVTRLGMGPAEMERIAELMASILVEGRDPAEVKRLATGMRSGFQQVRYCFTPGQPGN